MMKPRLLLLWLLLPLLDACEVSFDIAVQEVLNGTSTQELCEIVVQSIAVSDSEASTLVCVEERYAGTIEETIYGPVITQVSARAVAERMVGETAFVPFVFPFRGSIMASKYTVWPAFNETFCGAISDCNTTQFINVNVFDCTIPPPTPSPTILLVEAPTTSVPSQTATTFAPSSFSGGSSGGVMATRPPSNPPVDYSEMPPVATSKVMTKSPNKAPVAPSPTILPVATPPAMLPPTTPPPVLITIDPPTTTTTDPPVLTLITAPPADTITTGIQGAPSASSLRSTGFVAALLILMGVHFQS